MASKQMNGALVRGLSKSFIVMIIRGLAFITRLTKAKKVRP
jgi:hypothetical protein